MIENFVQEFRRAAKDSGYEEKLLIEGFKQEINRVIRRKLIETEQLPRNIKQWYEQVTSLNKH